MRGEQKIKVLYCKLKDGRNIGIFKDKLQCTIYGENYRILEEFSEFKKDIEYIRVSKEYIEEKFKLYKAVFKNDNKLISNYESNFEYKVGEYIIAKDTHKRFGGIYVGNKEYVLSSCYYKKGDSVLLEVKYDLDNLKHIDAEGNSCFYKLFIKEIIDID
ncbi:hypothetical protein [Clostridium perfringens]|uniref:hypothetical protein n=1 Tax=Clostridium perfringens TaxID=1502 RepID=UPI001159AEC0|nr:hypothetical protein [Clostridium perfringens]EHK2362423.1 hypothetical protein [Clostridium perfringens]EHR1329494.1 hypothetical protein [Clostridium perfringens]EHR1332580.1 hypothetical protein [Clostridium perfringens]EHR1426160.1 hypothetical protein [Clostridium perfringens]EIF6164932.1 hypothetical protein [Clostridium perfringens]